MTISLRLDDPHAQRWSMLLVPVFFGLVSVWLGADTNFDLRNYHLYNAYAFLTGRRGLDLAPAGMQSYFNPLLDLPYYYMSLHWASWLVGFIMGALHGCTFVLVLNIAKSSLPDLPGAGRYRLPLLLAAAGCLTANFLDELGATLGDVTTALFELGALWVILANWDALLGWSRRAAAMLLFSGAVAGLGVGLKLTNGVYALGLCAAFLAVPVPWPARLRLGFLFGLGVLLGFALTGGFWVAAMWHDYGNPLYPQFSAVFPSPLTSGVNAVDARWFPHGWVQVLFWPLLFTLNSHYVSELRVFQVIWALLYLLFLAWGGWTLSRRLRHRDAPAMEPRRLYVFAYIGIAFLLWMKLFGVYRYLVAIEMLAPLAVFMLLVHLLGHERGRRVTGWALGFAVFVVLMGATRSWGHAPWADPLYRADVPSITAPATTTVLTTQAGDGEPYAWLVPFFPRETAFLGVRVNFPESRRYAQRAHEIIRSRGGPVFAIIAGDATAVWDETEHAQMAASIVRANAWAARLGMTQSRNDCLPLRWFKEKIGLDVNVSRTPAQDGSVRCELILPGDTETEAAAKNRAYAAEYAANLALDGFSLDMGSCVVYTAYIGRGVFPYQWCKVQETAGIAQGK